MTIENLSTLLVRPAAFFFASFSSSDKKKYIWKTNTARPVLLRFGLLTKKRWKIRTNKHEIFAFFCYHWRNKIKLWKQTPVWVALYQLLALKYEHQRRRYGTRKTRFASFAEYKWNLKLWSITGVILGLLSTLFATKLQITRAIQNLNFLLTTT